MVVDQDIIGAEDGTIASTMDGNHAMTPPISLTALRNREHGACYFERIRDRLYLWNQISSHPYVQ